MSLAVAEVCPLNASRVDINTSLDLNAIISKLILTSIAHSQSGPGVINSPPVCTVKAPSTRLSPFDNEVRKSVESVANIAFSGVVALQA